ncbi:MAG TPA: hypothetical protein DEB17_05500 [Chlorobaculum sp.]|uniref:Uncharacterized protein n=1 Tax=Chlorobaculum tepidum (strain ATCC 49652 / DSM 12025 / NBRC 103806 / TLS) TaxID=194439 RepID=Q8KAP6_CHLTE|nr:hypothetical protein CT2110 [Chlorobaculum tepidum TLS]HBU23441.1 hypothetical protein [Chlorobaculum sp.]
MVSNLLKSLKKEVLEYAVLPFLFYTPAIRPYTVISP